LYLNVSGVAFDYVLDHLVQSSDPKIRQMAVDTIANSSTMRAVRATMAMMPVLAAVPSPAFKRHRRIYNVKNGEFNNLPGQLIRSEGVPRPMISRRMKPITTPDRRIIFIGVSLAETRSTTTA
jgi:hypothetical protein